MKILSLDVSTKTGWALLHDGQLIKYGLIKPPKESLIDGDDFSSNRISKIISFIEILTDEIKEIILTTNPDKIVIEQTNAGVLSSRLIQKLLEWIHYRILIMIVSTTKTYPFYISTSRWRSIIEVKLTKDQKIHNKKVKLKQEKNKVTVKHLAINKINELFNLDFKIKDNDKADAILIGLAFWRLNYGGT